MSITDYATTIVEKIGKANLNNVLKISDEVGADNFEDLALNIVRKSADIALENPKKSASIISIVSRYLNMYRANFIYNKQMIIDSCMLELCTVMRSV